MKNVIVDSFVGGIKDSFRLAAAIVVAPTSAMNAFINHELLPKEKGSGDKVSSGQKRMAKRRK